jgi:hypothetical protein
MKRVVSCVKVSLVISNHSEEDQGKHPDQEKADSEQAVDDLMQLVVIAFESLCSIVGINGVREEIILRLPLVPAPVEWDHLSL